MSLPNFLIIGAAKAGTTSLYTYLDQHPQVFMSPTKELRFFAFEGETLQFTGPKDEPVNDSVTSLETYKTYFAGSEAYKAVGEVSPTYLFYEKAAERIKRHIPNAKIIAILRQPVERAYSEFLFRVRDEREPVVNFDYALEQEGERIRQGWFGTEYLGRGYYYPQLKRYYDTLPEDQIKVYLYEDLKNDPAGLAKDIFRFLNVNDSFSPDMSIRYNVSGIPKSGLIHGLLTQEHPIKDFIRPFIPQHLKDRLAFGLRDRNFRRPPLAAETKKRLTQLYLEDIAKLEDLIGRDLSAWKV